MSRAKRWTLISGVLCLVTWMLVAVIALVPAAQDIQDAFGKWLKALAVAPAITAVIGFWVLGASGGPPDGTWGSDPGSYPNGIDL
ncbi:hypothetical protein ACFVHW_15040 [Streptomyces sp. NPDC127110]|uniref:hypothetical protein n=1 Tax=Streptomyces sp. NPDC127110 TaxID=3345362 RepID=UPI00362A26B1